MQRQITLSTILLSHTLLLSLFLISSMAADSSSSDAKVHIIYTERPEGVEPEQYHIRTLASVLGSCVEIVLFGVRMSNISEYEHHNCTNRRVAGYQFAVSELITFIVVWLKSEDAAKDALIYSYKHAASGFSAKLTPQQVAELSKQAGVLQVVPSQTLQLHSGTGKRHV
ncbi:hypothetical protein SASPL_113217 [Salvia splendens]|uniref:Inhibitor I9 domain-containing protein n=1 Tax=Salvia splendens TaxID=180675 RepID=A0A8X8Y476_SALSN|nr:hypothetical protein SASPL_113217 [Salvia splendens]